MNTWIWIVVAVLLVLLLLALARRTATGSVDPTQLLLDPTVMAQVRSLAESGQKVQAIALLRKNNPGLGLAAAKAMVDRMTAPGQASGSVPSATGPVAGPVAGLDPTAAWPASGAADLLPGNSFDLAAEAGRLKAAGRQIEAIKLVRQQTGCGLLEAKTYVDEL